MLIAAAVVLVVLGLVHSILAEQLFFRHLPRVSGFDPIGFPPIVGAPQSPMLVIHACWHMLTVLAFGFAAIFVRAGRLSVLADGDRFAIRAIAVTLALSGALVGVRTRGKHLGWVALLAAAVLAWLGVR